MKISSSVPLLFALCFTALLQTRCMGQPHNDEFAAHGNGLIYSEKTMSQLAHIVDSLNLKFKTCEVWKTYEGMPQAKAHYIFLDSLAKEAEQDLKSGIRLDAFRAKYPFAEVKENVLIIQSRYLDEEDSETINLEQFAPGRGYGNLEMNFKQGEPEANISTWKGRWVKETLDWDGNGNNSLQAFFFLEEFQSPVLPERYAAMVQYVDCMVDTTTQVILEEVQEGQDKDSAEQVDNFLTWVNDFPGMPNSYGKRFLKWDERRQKWVENELSKTPEFKGRLEAAIQQALAIGFSTEQLEEYAEKYHSPQVALLLKRHREVWGMCSQDDSPRIHATEIARLAAESASWEVFLRSHLNLLNDRFSRASDGSYAWARRGTYVGELEALGINISDLMLGITFRIGNPAKNHYYGSVGRVGRALTESKDRAAIEQQMLGIIADNDLDAYNRFIFINLYLSYVNHLEAAEQEAKKRALQAVVDAMPIHLRNQVKIE